MRCIKTFIVLAVAAFYFAVVAWRERTDQFVPDPMFCQTYLEDGRFVRTTTRAETLCELLAIIRLDAFDRAWERLYKMFQELHGGIGAVLLKSLDKAPAGELINGSILIEMLSSGIANKAGGWDKFHIDLDAFPWMVHLLIGFGDIFGVGRMDSHDPLLFEETVKAGDGAGVAALSKFNPEDDKAGMGIASAHIGDKFDLLRSVLIGMMVWSSGSVAKGFDRAIETVYPAVNVLTVGFVPGGSTGDTIFFSVTDK